MTDRNAADCIIVKMPCCKKIVFAAVNIPSVIDRKTKKEIGEMVAEGGTVEHITAEEVRKAEWCDCGRELKKKSRKKPLNCDTMTMFGI